MPNFEIALYNEEVRSAIKNGEKHDRFEDSWANTHYVEVSASGEGMAQAKIEKQYPAHRGFVIEQITKVLTD